MSTNSAVAEKLKRKKRTKEEIEKEAREKSLNKIQRESQTSYGSKCEEYLFCSVDLSLTFIDVAIEWELKSRFSDRSLESQVSFNQTIHNGQVIWKRRHVKGVVDNDVVKRITEDIVEACFLHLLDEGSFIQMTKTDEFETFVDKVIEEHDHPAPMLTVAVYGASGPKNWRSTNAAFAVYEKHTAQVRFCNNAEDFSFLVVQMHRAVAKLSKKENALIADVHTFDMDKGVDAGDNLKKDWWLRMLGHIHRISEEQKRAVVTTFPDPFHLSDQLTAMKHSNAINMLASIETGNGRRVGAVMAKTIYTLLTSTSGTEVIIDTGAR